MKLWPQSRRRKIALITLIVTLAVFGSLGGYLEYSVYREVASPMDVLNPTAPQKALVVYHPGLSDFAKNVTYTYADALAETGWRVEITTASPQAPRDISNYKLLVLTWAIYDFNPAPTIKNQLNRIGDLQGTNTVILAIGGGLDPFHAPDTMKKMVQDANGTLIQTLTTFRSNRNLAELVSQASEIKPGA